MARKSEGRLAYADLLRAAALICLILQLLAQSRLEAAAVSTSAWTVYNAYASLTRWSGPIFIMLSGAFLLDPKRSGRFSVHALRMLRLFLALVIWSAVYAVAGYLSRGGRLGLNGFLSALRAASLGDVADHLWFLYLFLGLYLAAPILRAFVKGASRADFHYFFLLTFLVTFLLPTAVRFYPGNALTTHLNRMQLHLVLGYVGYFVAGYYLKTYTISRLAEAIIYILGAGGAFVTLWGTAVLSRRAGGLNDVLYDTLTPNVCATAVAVFVLFRYVLGISDERDRRRRMAGVGRITLGIYVLVPAFRHLFTALGLFSLPLPPALALPLYTALVFLPSFAGAWLLSNIPVLGPYLT